MWHARVALIRSMMAASVVDFPEPVGPVTSTRPWSSLVSDSIAAGRPSSSTEWIVAGISRSTAAAPFCWTRIVDAEASDAGERVGEVEIEVGLELLPLLRARDLAHQLAHGGVVEHVPAVGRHELAAHAQARADAGHQVEIRAPQLLQPCQQLVDARHRVLPQADRFFGSAQ